MNGTLAILNYTQEASIGVYEWEHHVKQPLWFDITMQLALDVTNDAIAETVNYDEVILLLKKLLQQQHFQLIETVAIRSAQHILAQFLQIDEIEIKVRKKAIKEANHVEFSYSAKRAL